MSGFKSFARCDVPDPTTLPLPHAAPDLAARHRRVRAGRWRLALLLAACAVPVVASYLAYHVVRPQGRTNYGALIRPSRSLGDTLALRAPDGAPVAAASLRGQWLLVLVVDGPCDAACEQRIYLQRQLREMVGRKRDRIDRVWLLAGDAPPPPPAMRAAAEATGGVTLLRADAAALARWLEPAEGHALAEHLYLVDPMGEWMMRAPAEPDPQRVKRDLDRLLRASASWDRAGR